MGEYKIQKVRQTAAAAVVADAVDVAAVAHCRIQITLFRPRLILCHIDAGRLGGGYQVVAILAIVIFVAFFVEFGQ